MSEPGAEVTAPLQVFAAGSLRSAFDALAEHWPAPVELRYANAAVLAEAILAGEQADVFASASPHEPERLARIGIAEAARPFAANHLVVAAPLASRIDAIGALGAPGVRVCLEVPGIPLGDYTRELLGRLDEALGGDFARRVLANVVVEGDNVDRVSAALYGDEADVAILYATDVAASGGRLRAIEPPPEAAVTATYVACALWAAAQPDGAEAWLNLMLGPVGQAVLQRAGFAPAV